MSTCLFFVFVMSTPAHAGEFDSIGPGVGAITLGLGVGTRSFDRLAESDPRPERRGEQNVSLEIGYQFANSLRASVQGRLGGTYFDFDGVFGSGNAPEQAWSVRPGLDWFPRAGRPVSAYVGVGYEYGEARSWVTTTLSSIEGPRNYFNGIGARIGIGFPLVHRLRLRTEAMISGYRAHSYDEQLYTHYRWAGTGTAVTIGLDFDIIRGAQSMGMADP